MLLYTTGIYRNFDMDGIDERMSEDWRIDTRVGERLEREIYRIVELARERDNEEKVEGACVIVQAMAVPLAWGCRKMVLRLGICLNSLMAHLFPTPATLFQA